MNNRDMFTGEVYSKESGELNDSLTLKKIEDNFINKKDTRLTANLLTALIHRNDIYYLKIPNSLNYKKAA